MMADPGPATSEKALRLREHAKAKKPRFVRQESWKYVRLKENWRRPRGLDNKVRKRIKGWPPLVSAGYRGPKLARRLHPSGFEIVVVHNSEQLKKIDPKAQAVQIAHRVGKRKRIKILAEARKKKLIVLNIREVKRAEETAVAEKVEEEKPEEKEEAKEASKPKQEGRTKKGRRKTERP